VVDEQAALGVATTRMEERLLASVGQLQAAPIRFEAVDDVPSGGVLCALPALLVLGLLRHTAKSFSLPAGYYPLETIFLVVVFLALARIKSLEALRYQPPGEWGKPFIERRQTEVVEKILRHCGLWEEAPARDPPPVSEPVMG